MRIGLVVPGFSADADDWCIPALRHLARTLAARDDVRVFALRYPYHRSRYTVDGAEVVALGGALSHRAQTLVLWRDAIHLLRSEHRRRPFDVLHAFWATESGLLAAIAGRLLGVPTLVSLAGGELVALRDIGYGDQRLAWERLKVAASLRLASAVSAGSKQLVATAERHLHRQGVHLAPLGVDLSLFSSRAQSESALWLHPPAGPRREPPRESPREDASSATPPRESHAPAASPNAAASAAASLVEPIRADASAYAPDEPARPNTPRPAPPRESPRADASYATPPHEPHASAASPDAAASRAASFGDPLRAYATDEPSRPNTPSAVRPRESLHADASSATPPHESHAPAASPNAAASAAASFAQPLCADASAYAPDEPSRPSTPSAEPPHAAAASSPASVAQPASSGAYRVLQVATLTPVKDQATLLRAFALVHHERPNATLHIVGEGPLHPQLSRLAEQLGLTTSVHFAGAVDHAELPALYASANVFVVSSRHEAQSMVALEAAACGTPVVGTRVGLLPEITDAIAPVGNIEALAQAISATLDCPVANTDEVRANYGLESCADRFRALYASLTATSSVPPNSAPTDTPSSAPTGTPSSASTGTPSSAPTATSSSAPTGTPSSAPTGTPSPAPTGAPRATPSPSSSTTPSATWSAIRT